MSINELKDKIKINKNIFIFTFIFTFIFFIIFLLQGFKLNTVNDKVFQYDLFYEEWYRLLYNFINGKGFPEYSWNLYLGSDFYSSMAYYVTGDIFVFLFFPLYLLGIKLTCLLTLETYLCIFFSSINFYFYIKETKVNEKNDNINICASLIYAFGGFAVLFYGNYMWHRAYCFLPLLFYGVEHYFNKNNWLVISLIVFILFLQNFYLMYPISIFLFIYSLTRLFAKKFNVKDLIIKLLIILFAYFVGFCLSAFLSFPAFCYVLSSPRLNSHPVSSLFWSFSTYIEFFISFIVSPFPLNTNISNIFADVDYYEYWFSNFIGIVPFVSALYLCKKKENLPYLISMIIILLIAFLKPLSVMMHGFNEPCMRWLFIVPFYFLFLYAKSVGDNQNIPINRLIITLFASIILFVLVFFIKKQNVAEYSSQIISFVVFISLSFITVYLYSKNQSLSMVMCLLIIFDSTILMTQFYTKDRQKNEYERVSYDLLQYYQEIDQDTCFRWYINENNLPGPVKFNFNNNLHMNIMSNRVYSSTYDYNTLVFDEMNNASKDPQNGSCRQIDNPYSLTAIGTKYWVVLDESELPKELEFEYYCPLEDMHVYKNLNYLGFGYTSTSIKNINDMKDPKTLLDTIYVDSSIDLSKYQNPTYSKFNVYVKGNNYINGGIELDSDNILFLPIPNTKGWKLKVNGIKQEILDVNGGFIGIELKAGYSDINLSFSSPLLKEGMIISFLTTVLIICYLLVEKDFLGKVHKFRKT